MSTSTRADLLHATEAAWKAARTQTAGGGGPRPGDVFVIPETSHLAVEWVVIEEHPASGRLYAVPADTWDQVGSQDVHVEAGSACGPLSLRCGLGLWLPAEQFDPDLRSGVLERLDLDRARQAVERGAVDATEAQRETDTELEYREWIEKGPVQARGLLDRAWKDSSLALRAAEIPPGPPFSKGGKDSSLTLRPLGRRGGHPPSFEKGGAGGRISPSERGGWRRVGRRPLALAASLILATVLAAGGAMLWRLRTDDPEIGHTSAKPKTFTLFRTRGVQPIPVPSGVQALELHIADSYPEPLRVEVWSEDPPRTIGISESLTIVLPRRLLPAGKYRVLVLALRDDREVRLGDYRIEIKDRE